MFSFHVGNKHICIKKEIIVPLLMLAFTVAYYAQSYQLSKNSLAFPSVFLIILLITSVYSIIKSITIVTPEVEEREDSALVTKKVVLYFLMLALFVFALPYIGVYIAIPAFLVITMLLLNVRNIKTLIIIPVAVTVAIHLVFVVLLSTRLPTGPF